MWDLIFIKARALKRYVPSERGQAMVEYGLIMCLIVIVVLITLIVLGNQVRNTYCNILGQVVSAGS
jgi:Flp pilus assembly pilin Flp